ncbi:MAG: ferrous iron transport protein A [Sulfuricurvum sp.]
MCLLDSGVNKICRVISIDLAESLKEHLCAMGICPNATVCVKRYGWFKSSVQVQIGQRVVALGKEQACAIQVHTV